MIICTSQSSRLRWSLPVRGAWIEMFTRQREKMWEALSLPVRGAWIEISCGGALRHPPGLSLPVRGAWIEILIVPQNAAKCHRRSPCGERGLK